MRFLRPRLLHRTVLPIVRLRLHRSILRRIPVLLHGSSLLLIHARLRSKHRLHPTVISTRVVGAILLSKRAETFLIGLVGLRLTGLLVRERGPRRRHRTHQRLLIQTSPRLRLPLLDWTHRRRWRP